MWQWHNVNKYVQQCLQHYAVIEICKKVVRYWDTSFAIIEFVCFAVDFIRFAVESDAFEIEFVGFEVEFGTLALELLHLHKNVN